MMQMTSMMGVGAEAVDVTVVMGMIQVIEATTEVAITEVAITDVAVTEVATTDVAVTEVATTDVAVTKVATINFCYLTINCFLP